MNSCTCHPERSEGSYKHNGYKHLLRVYYDNLEPSGIYIGVTNDLRRRVYEHKQELIEGFTKKYHVHKLVYCESCGEIKDAIAREKQLKGWTRKRKNELIETTNPYWKEIIL